MIKTCDNCGYSYKRGIDKKRLYCGRTRFSCDIQRAFPSKNDCDDNFHGWAPKEVAPEPEYTENIESRLGPLSWLFYKIGL